MAVEGQLNGEANGLGAGGHRDHGTIGEALRLMIVRVEGEEQQTILHMAGRGTDVLTREAERAQALELIKDDECHMQAAVGDVR